MAMRAAGGTGVDDKVGVRPDLGVNVGRRVAVDMAVGLIVAVLVLVI